MHKQKAFSLLLCLLLLFSMITTAQAAVLPFTDIPTNAWYYEAVSFTYENHLFSGVSSTEFEPETTMSRAMLVSVLHRSSGSPTPGTNTDFVDVSSGLWYSDAVAWGAAQGIVYGEPSAQGLIFAPDRNVTREQMVSILYRYANLQGYDTSARNSLNQFFDRSTVSAYALDAFRWAVVNGIISGVTRTRLTPAGTATRSQVASILMRFMQRYDDDPTNDPTPGVEVPAGTSDSIQVNGKSYQIGMTTAQLVAVAGQPAEQLPVLAGYTWYVYGTKTYQDFIMVGIYQNKVVALCASGPNFFYRGYAMGDQIEELPGSTACWITAYTDQNDSDKLHCIFLLAKSYQGTRSVSLTTALASEAKTDFHLVNAFRCYHNRGILQWHSAVANAALLHSADMANYNYFSHTGRNGSSPSGRITAQGVSFFGCGENIYAYTYGNALNAHDSWVNSTGHRQNMLTSYYTHLGVGAAYQSNSYYSTYFTEDYIYR